MSTARASAVPTRERIVEAALRLFAERGTTAVSMRELADAAGVTVPGLYYHFASKAELISEVYRARGFGQAPDEVVLPEPAPVEAMIVTEANQEFTRFLAEREFLSLMQGEAVLGDEDALAVGKQLAARWRARWISVLACAVDIAPDADLPAAADAIATFLWGLFVEFLRRDADAVGERTAAAGVSPAAGSERMQEDDRIAQFARLIAPALR
ncbi:MAG TPA: helix-turn-helix domain-containing protein [Acidimicrobiia bacterium]|nr:helix-turn-helix domain-containing protein [Acidimicrobiia bacterium]